MPGVRVEVGHVRLLRNQRSVRAAESGLSEGKYDPCSCDTSENYDEHPKACTVRRRGHHLAARSR